MSLALAGLLVPVPAHAQDATVLVLLGAPPLLMSPLVAALIRFVWMRRVPASRFSLRSGLPLSVLEFVLWLLAAWVAALVYFQESWGAAVVLVALLAGIVALNRRFAPPSRSWLFSVALAGVLPAAWCLIQLAWYGAVLWWDA